MSSFYLFKLVKINILIQLFLFIFFLNVAKADEPCDELYEELCKEKTNCLDCINSHPRCFWNFQNGGSCISIKQISKTNIEYNGISQIIFEESENFTGEYQTHVIQVKPQKLKLKLRKGMPLNISFSYQQTKHYPLDLYYLIDISSSMRPYKEQIQQLAGKLAEELKFLTKNYRIAYGSFVDKPLMPFYCPVEMKRQCLENPELSCNSYSFKHSLNFTNKIDLFKSEVNISKMQGNLDNLEGGFDAVMQIINCKERLGWREDSRKLIFLPTDSTLHWAGDGLLSGSIKPITNQCLLDDNNTANILDYDFPSLEQIYKGLKHKKINLIIASKQNTLKHYQRLHNALPDTTYVEELKDISISPDNIIEVVKLGYNNFAKQVQFSLNDSRFQVEMYADCDDIGNYEKKSSCHNMESGKKANFIAEIKAYENIKITKKEYVRIEEKVLHSAKIELEIETFGFVCSCAENSSNTCKRGENICGKCKCDPGWSGEQCDIECSYEENLKCKNSSSDYCSGVGECSCGKCLCPKPYTGQFCEKRCPVNDRLEICSGRGTCGKNGLCYCDEGYSGEICDCQESESNCKLAAFNETCMGHGHCICNKCNCFEGSGDFCEKQEEDLVCSKIKDCVSDYIINNKTCPDIQVEKTKHLPGKRNSCSAFDLHHEDKWCRVTCYYQIYKSIINVFIITSDYTIFQSRIAIGFYAFIPIIVLGICAIAIIKLINIFRDRREYDRFKKQQQQQQKWARESNPLYNNPISEFKNPMYKENHFE